MEKPDRTSRLAVVIPALNEAPTIGGIVAACRALPFVSGVIVVDDGSRDATAAIAEAAGARVLRHSVNRGKGASLQHGLGEAVRAGAVRVATLDGDGQHRPGDLSRLLAHGLAWPDRLVIGSRRASRRDAPRARFVANRVADFWVSWAAGHPIADSQSGFRLYPAALVHALAERPPLASGFAYESEVLIEAARLGFHTVALDIPSIYGDALRRPSHFRPVSDITRIVLMVAGKLLRRGMYPAGLWRSLTSSEASKSVDRLLPTAFGLDPLPFQLSSRGPHGSGRRPGRGQALGRGDPAAARPDHRPWIATPPSAASDDGQ